MNEKKILAAGLAVLALINPLQAKPVRENKKNIFQVRSPPLEFHDHEFYRLGACCVVNLKIKRFKLVYDPNKIEFRELGLIDSIIIHHTASKFDLSAADIDCGHKANGYACIGYHYLIHKDGTIEKCRDNNMVGAHCYGHNKTSLGIALSGNFEKEQPTAEQISALSDLITALKVAYPKINSVQGHCFYNVTACPGCKLDRLCKDNLIYN